MLYSQIYYTWIYFLGFIYIYNMFIFLLFLFFNPDLNFAIVIKKESKEYIGIVIFLLFDILTMIIYSIDIYV